MKRLIWLAALAACATKSGAPSEAVPTLGDVCEEAGRAACVRALQCNQTFTDEDLCTNGFVRRCCEEEGTCEDDVPAGEADLWSACTLAVETAECEGFRDRLPEACEGLGLTR